MTNFEMLLQYSNDKVMSANTELASPPHSNLGLFFKT